jgi:hypothetical protein
MSKPGYAYELRVRGGHYAAIRIRDFLVVYLIAMVVWVASIAESISTGVPISLLVHPCIGIFLTRFATRKFEVGQLHWNWYKVSVGDIVKTKLEMMLGWPLTFPRLIGQLIVFRYL